MGKQRIPPDLQLWIDARRRFHLSHAHVQLARELGMNPKKLGKLANHKQERWKAPLPQFIEDCYFKRFRRERPENVMSIEDRFRSKKAKQTKKLAEQERTPTTLPVDAVLVVERPRPGTVRYYDLFDMEGREAPF
jgi:hypothetical protein